MRMRNVLLGTAAAAMIASAAQAASITTSLRLQTTAGVDLPMVSPGVYDGTAMANGDYRLVISVKVNDPYSTAATGHEDIWGDTTFDGQVLGLQNLVYDVRTGGTAGAFVPKALTAFTPPRWSGYTRLVSSTFGDASANLIDRDSDSDLDVAGTGVYNNGLGSWATIDSTYQVGAFGFTDVVRGTFTWNGAGGVTVYMTSTDSQVFKEKDNLMESEAIAVPFTSGMVTITVPEPATAGLALLGLGGLALRRRRA